MSAQLCQGRPFNDNIYFHHFLFRIGNKVYTDVKRTYNPETAKLFFTIEHINGLPRIKINPNYKIKNLKTNSETSLDLSSEDFLYEHNTFHCFKFPEFWMPY